MLRKRGGRRQSCRLKSTSCLEVVSNYLSNQVSEQKYRNTPDELCHVELELHRHAAGIWIKSQNKLQASSRELLREHATGELWHRNTIVKQRSSISISLLSHTNTPTTSNRLRLNASSYLIQLTPRQHRRQRKAARTIACGGKDQRQGPQQSS